MKRNKRGASPLMVTGVIALVVVAVVLSLLGLNQFGIIGGVTQQAIGSETPAPTGSVVQISDTSAVELRAYASGLKLSTRTQLATSYVVYRNSQVVKSGTLSSSDGTAFSGAYNTRFDWASYDDNGSGDDYYLETGSFNALPAEDYELNLWKEAGASDMTVTFLENDGTANDGTVVIGTSGDKVIQMQVELNNLNVKFANMGGCIDWDAGNFTDVAFVGSGVSDMSLPVRLDGNSFNKCFKLGQSLPTANTLAEGAKSVVSYTLALSSSPGKNPVQNITMTLFDMTKYIDPVSGLPTADVAAENRYDNSNIGAADKTGITLNVQ